MPINTLEFAKRMTKAAFTREQAEAQAELFAEIVESDLATKRDLKDVEVTVKSVEASLKRDIKELEVGLKRDIKDLEVGIKAFEANTKRDMKELELKMWRMTVGSAVLVTTLVGFMIRFIKP